MHRDLMELANDAKSPGLLSERDLEIDPIALHVDALDLHTRPSTTRQTPADEEEQRGQNQQHREGGENDGDDKCVRGDPVDHHALQSALSRTSR